MDIKKLIDIQNRIAKKVILKPFELPQRYKIAAFDVSFKDDIGYGVCIVVDERMEIVEERTIKKRISFPYIPTFLAFRELPLIMELYRTIKNKPDLILIDGNGLIHPRRCGIAVHFGVIVKKPTIGVAKSYLYGLYKEPENSLFSYSYIYHEDGSIIGAALRTKVEAKPIFISPGNLIDIQSSLKIIKGLIQGYRIPYPLRIADIRAKAIKNKM